MAETQNQKHIKVNAHDDEVVIFAGQSRGNASEPIHDANSVSVDDIASVSEEVKNAPLPEDAQSSPKKSKENVYRETTLADIDSFKMSKAQKAVIIVAVLGLLAFVVWYVAFSR